MQVVDHITKVFVTTTILFFTVNKCPNYVPELEDNIENEEVMFAIINRHITK